MFWLGHLTPALAPIPAKALRLPDCNATGSYWKIYFNQKISGPVKPVIDPQGGGAGPLCMRANEVPNKLNPWVDSGFTLYYTFNKCPALSACPTPDYRIIEIGFTNMGPCWHAQQLTTFQVGNMLYSFMTYSAPREGQAYLLGTRLTAEGHVDKSDRHGGTVQWYELQKGQPQSQIPYGFNHPGDLALFGRIVVTANQNYAVGSGKWYKKDGPLASYLARCKANVLGQHEQALTIWDFGASIDSGKPTATRFDIKKHEFDSILEAGDKMDNSDADDLWGGDVNGNFILRFEGKWFRWKNEYSATGAYEYSHGQVCHWNYVRAQPLAWNTPSRAACLPSY